MAAKALPSQEVLRQLLDYDPETGALTWRGRGVEWFKDGRQTREHNAAIWNSKNAGRPAFTAISTGYRYGAILDQNLLAHRVIWKMVHGVDPDHIDHINGNRSDNRLANLRNVDATANTRNSRIPNHNTSGHLGVSFDKGRCKWAAYITVSGRKVSLGRFACIGQAIKSRKEAARRHGFHANHGRAA